MGRSLGGGDRHLGAADVLVRHAAKAALLRGQRTGTSAAPTLTLKHPPQSSQRPFNLLPIAIDFSRPSAELIVGNRGRLIEVLAIEEESAHDAAEDSARTVMRRRSSAEKNFVNRTR